MKNNLKFLTIGVAAVFSVMVLLWSCTKESNTPEGAATSQPIIKSVTFSSTGTGCVVIYGGQNINAGTLCMDDIDTNNDGLDDALQVTVTTTGCWQINGVASWFGCATCKPPLNKAGNPIIGHFPYQSGTLATQSYTFTIPFNSLSPGFSCSSSGGESLNLRGAVHVNLRNTCNNTTETGWAAGDQLVQRGSWATWFGFNITCDCTNCNEEDPCEASETAMAMDNGNLSTCIIDNFGLDAQRWGWSNGPYSGNASLTLWAGAGQCNTTVATNAGTVTLTLNGTTLHVHMEAASGHPIGEVAMYAGSAPLFYDCSGPNCGYNVAPGQQPYLGNTVSYATSLDFDYPYPITAPYYVYIHIESWGFPCIVN
jgi:hypothetical protein